jgi:hypothetical protein
LAAFAVAAPAAAAAPREGVWVSYRASAYSSSMEPRGGFAIGEEGDAYYPAFSVSLRQVRGDVIHARVRADETTSGSPARGRAPVQAREIDRLNGGWGPDGEGGASLLLRLAALPLPRAEGGEFFAFYRRMADPERNRWWANELLTGRGGMLEIDLMAPGASPAAAAACRSVRISMPGNAAATRDRCTIEAIVGAADGWPAVVEISRSIAAANGATAMESVKIQRSAPAARR